MDPLAVGSIVGFVVVGVLLLVGCCRSRGPRMGKSPSGLALVDEAGGPAGGHRRTAAEEGGTGVGGDPVSVNDAGPVSF